MIDRSGTVRWIDIEASDGPEEFGKLPNLAEMLRAARALDG